MQPGICYTSKIINDKKEIGTVMSVILYVIKFCSKFLPDFYSLDNVDLQNKNVIELMEWVVYEAV